MKNISPTRNELYELVWTTSMVKLAARFGISASYIKITCERNNIPTPERGYWAMSERSRQKLRVSLPARGLGKRQFVRWGSHSGWRFEEPVFEEPISTITQRALKAVANLDISVSLRAPAPAIAKYLKKDEIRGEKALESTWSHLFYKKVFDTPFERRRLTILSWIAKAIERVGGKLDISGVEARELRLTVGDTELQITLDDPKLVGNYQHRVQKQTEGNLCLALYDHEAVNHFSYMWTDGKTKLEDQISSALVTLIVEGEARLRRSAVQAYEEHLIQEKKREQDRRDAQGAEAIRIAKELQEAHDRRIARLCDQAAAYSKARTIREYVGHLKANTPVSDAFNQWAIWALGQANSIDPVLSEAWKLDQSD
jgi:hypothetical protein